LELPAYVLVFLPGTANHETVKGVQS
jgi:hypothetical protein